MNVLVICCDSLRNDHLGFLNRHPVHTPHLDQLASESAYFADFWLCSFPTLAHRSEVFTGRYTFPLFGRPSPSQFPVLAEVFQRHGFTTALFADNWRTIKKRYGFLRGFDVVRAVRGQAHDKFQPRSAPMADLPCPEKKIGVRPSNLQRYRRNRHWYQQHGTDPTATLFQAMIEWLSDPPDRFFLWVDAFDPHEPWDAPAEFLKPYPWNQQGDAVLWPRQGSKSLYSAADLDNMRSLYRAEVSYLDHWIGRLMDHIRDSPLSRTTTVMFCSDHGYYFGEHDLLGKLSSSEIHPIHDGLGHIPLLLRHPTGLGAGATIKGFAQPLDLFATSLDCAGIPPVPWAQGHSLLPRLRGEPSPQRFAVSGVHPPGKGDARRLTIQTEEWCLVYSPSLGLEGSELYHLASDQSHMHNVIGDHPEVARRLFDQLVSWFDDLGVPVARKKRMLYNDPINAWQRMKYKIWRARNRFFYWKNYRNYATGKNHL